MPPTRDEDGLEELLVFMRDARGFDFTGYKRASLQRRIKKRMDEVGISEMSDYLGHLESQPEEFGHLFNTILINVTSFFRDAPMWDVLKRDVIPSLIATTPPDAQLRLWSAGCASGEEPYSLAMLFAEALGEEAFRTRVKIYATDVDEDALTQARQAAYPASSLEPIPDQLRKKHFEKVGSRYQLKQDLRRTVIFGRHDLTQDAPIARIDLLLCRNLLMYFNPDTQARIASSLAFALRDSGYLVLGHAEMMLARSDLFDVVDLSERIFRRRPAVGRRAFDQSGIGGAVGSAEMVTLEQAALELAPHPTLLLDASARVIGINGAARRAFGLRSDDLQRPFKDLEISYRPFELRSRIDDAMTGQKQVRIENLERTLPDGEKQSFDVRVIPLVAENKKVGVVLHLEDVTEFKRLHADHLRANQELETAYEELQSTNEELETTNEELQSTNEELETTNEELQSTNEELETMNEELQSANSELQAINEEFQRTSQANKSLSEFMASVVSSVNVGLVVVNERVEVMTWNRQAEDLWGLRSDEVRGQQLLELDIGLPVADLRAPIVACLTGSGEERLELAAVNRRGAKIRCRITCTPLRTGSEGTQEVVLLMEVLPSPARPSRAKR